MKRLIAKTLVLCLAAFGISTLQATAAQADDDPLTVEILTTVLWGVSTALYPSVQPNADCAVCDQVAPQLAEGILSLDLDAGDAVAFWLDFVGAQVGHPSTMASTCGAPNIGFSMTDDIGTWVCSAINLDGKRIWSWVLDIS
jgi:hypothetical protein